MNRLLKYGLIIGVVAACLTYAIFACEKSANASQKKVCSDIQIFITDYDKKMLISKEEIAILLKQKNLHPIGETLARIHTKSIEDEIEKHPMVRRAECYKSPEGTVYVSIEQRTPILRVVGDENYYVDDMRKIMPVSLNHTAYVPIFSGRVTHKMATGSIFDFAQFLSEDKFWGNQIDQININKDMKVELVPRVGNHIIMLGNFDRYEQKLKKLKKFYLYGLNEVGWDSYSKIDLQYRDQVVCTRKN
ncbi:MAG: cell division protein FtsQ [Bacteroidales bacterium]|nr:cell division protein FtsQ [Bacteroidales bacterium]